MESRLKPIDWKKVWQQPKGKGPFQDPHFKACRDSIIDPMIMRSTRIQNWDNLQWKRPSEVYGAGNYELFGSLQPSEVVQGQLNTGYFLSALSSLVEDPDRIKSLFLINKVNQ